jgi:hypothetical protein
VRLELLDMSLGHLGRSLEHLGWTLCYVSENLERLDISLGHLRESLEHLDMNPEHLE